MVDRRIRYYTIVNCLIICLLAIFIACGEVETKWIRKFEAAGPGDYRINSMVCSREDIYLTGKYVGPDDRTACFVARYDKAGSLIWHQTYEAPENLQAAGREILITITQKELLSAHIDIYVLTETQDAEGVKGAVLLKYDTLGNIKWERTAASNKGSLMSTLLSDFEGNLYLAGWEATSEAEPTISITKFSESGEILWFTKYYNKELDFSDLRFHIMEPEVFVVAGMLKSTNEIFYMKYDGSGHLRGITKYAAGTQVKALSGMLTAHTGHVFMTANIANAETGDDFLTLAYDNTDSLLWANEYDGEAHLADMSSAISVDESLNVYVTGTTENAEGVPNIVTAKYNKSGNRLWVQSLRQNKRTQSLLMEPRYIRTAQRRPHLSYLYIAGTIGDDGLILRCNTNGVYSFQAHYGEKGSKTIPTALTEKCLALQRTRNNRSEALITKLGPSAILGIARWD